MGGAWPWLLLLALISFLGGVATGWPLLQHLGYGVAAVDLFALLVGLLAGRGLSMKASVNRLRVTAGEKFDETFEIGKRGLWPALWLELLDDSGVCHPVTLRSGSCRIVRSRLADERGLHVAAGGLVRVRDPLGLFTLSRSRLESIYVTIHPRPMATASASLFLSRQARKRARHQLPSADPTSGELRGYRAGDPISRIHWRSTARTGRLHVTDPAPASDESIWLLVDAGGPHAEASIGIAAYVARGLSQSRQPLGLILAGLDTEVVPPETGRRQTAEILDCLALIECGGRSRLDTLLVGASEQGRADSFILVTGAPLTEASLRLAHRLPRLEIIRADASLSRTA
jgi:uncharacterized protein (DUF58 family)